MGVSTSSRKVTECRAPVSLLQFSSSASAQREMSKFTGIAGQPPKAQRSAMPSRDAGMNKKPVVTRQ